MRQNGCHLRLENITAIFTPPNGTTWYFAQSYNITWDSNYSLYSSEEYLDLLIYYNTISNLTETNLITYPHILKNLTQFSVSVNDSWNLPFSTINDSSNVVYKLYMVPANTKRFIPNTSPFIPVSLILASTSNTTKLIVDQAASETHSGNDSVNKSTIVIAVMIPVLAISAAIFLYFVYKRKQAGKFHFVTGF